MNYEWCLIPTSAVRILQNYGVHIIFAITAMVINVHLTFIATYHRTYVLFMTVQLYNTCYCIIG